nr:fibroblast growth factor receptor 2-like [Pocillopora verrucosa]
MICHMKHIFVWIFLIPQPTDGGSVTWHEPTPAWTTSDPAELLPPGIIQVYDGSSVTLNWNYSLTLGLVFGAIKFNSDGIVIIQGDGSAGPLTAQFQKRFNVSSTSGRASLFISPVTVADDKSLGEFRCELIDSTATTWKRAIQVQVIVPLSITGIRGKTTVLEGDNLQLICEASSREEPKITWTKEKTVNQGNTVVVQEGKVLTIANINRTDVGKYTCTADNGFGKPEDQTVYVNVTYPPKIVDFQHEYMVGVQQSLTLSCEAEGNPPPTYTWTPCDPEQVCDKDTLHISQVLNDANFTFRVANVYGDDSKTATVYIGGNVINITIVITSEICIDGKYNQSLLLEKLKKPLEEAFADKPGYEGVQLIGVRCGSIIVDLALKFNSSAKERDVIITLNDTVKDGKLGELSVAAIKGKTPDVEPTGGGATSPLDRSHGESLELPSETKTGAIGIVVGAVFGSVAALAVAGVLVWWTCRKKRHNRKSNEEVGMSRRTFGNSSNETGGSTNIAVELPKPSQSHYMGLDDRTRSQVIADASPLSTEQISEYASLNLYTRSWEIPREHVTIKQIVGKGAFGQVAKATAVNLQGRAEKTLVAVKMLKEKASESERKDLLSELELMKQLKPHRYVIKLLGCVTKWSYGVLLYEIFTIGGSPYPRMDGRKIANLLQEGYRMPKPQHVDDKLYDFMTKCWKDDPNLRPSFEKLRNKLKEMENQHKGLINLKNYDDRLYVNVDDLAV